MVINTFDPKGYNFFSDFFKILNRLLKILRSLAPLNVVPQVVFLIRFFFYIALILVRDSCQCSHVKTLKRTGWKTCIVTLLCTSSRFPPRFPERIRIEANAWLSSHLYHEASIKALSTYFLTFNFFYISKKKTSESRTKAKRTWSWNLNPKVKAVCSVKRSYEY